MVYIILTNQKKNASYPYEHARFDPTTGFFQLEDGQNISRETFLTEKFFDHPLLHEPYTHQPNHLFKYEYNNLTELMSATTFICSVLIHTDNPEACKFIIQPSCLFQQQKRPQSLYFSIDYRKSSQNSINLNQLNALASKLLGEPFHFSEDLIFQHHFSIKNLPHTINGDALYQDPTATCQLLKTPIPYEKYELRYIHPIIGFGVFSRLPLKKGDFIGIYTGIQSYSKGKNLNYSFTTKDKSATTYVHALHAGNLTRFINHAPKVNPKAPSPFLSANIKALHYQRHGLHFIVFEASQDIPAGEQLLVSYGERYFPTEKNIRFKSNGKLAHQNKYARNKIFALKAMAEQGIQAAQIYLLKRLVIITTAILTLIGAMHLI